MKLTEFTYTKPNGEITQRVVLTTKEYSKTIAGHDVTHLTGNGEAFQKLVNEYNALEAKILEMRNKFWSDNAAADKYREFLPERMTNVTHQYYTSK